MNTGKIMIGFSLILLSVAMIVSPSGASGLQNSCDVGCRISAPFGETGNLTGLHPGCPAVFVSAYTSTDATYSHER
jgi:hypothetical protein